MAKVVRTRPPRRSAPVQTPPEPEQLPAILHGVRQPKSIDRDRRYLAATAAQTSSPPVARTSREAGSSSHRHRGGNPRFAARRRRQGHRPDDDPFGYRNVNRSSSRQRVCLGETGPERHTAGRLTVAETRNILRYRAERNESLSIFWRRFAQLI